MILLKDMIFFQSGLFASPCTYTVAIVFPDFELWILLQLTLYGSCTNPVRDLNTMTISGVLTLFVVENLSITYSWPYIYSVPLYP